MTFSQKIKYVLNSNKNFIACIVCCLIALILLILCEFNIMPLRLQTLSFYVCLTFIALACIFNYFATKDEQKRRSKKDV